MKKDKEQVSRKNSILVFVGDFGTSVISEKTLSAYSTEFLAGNSTTWRRSSKLRDNERRMYEDLSAVQRYFWKRQEERNEL